MTTIHEPSGLRRGFVALVLPLLLLAATTRGEAQEPGETGMPEMMMEGTQMTWSPTLFVIFDELEYMPNAAGRPVEVDATSFYGGAVNRVWLRAQGEVPTTERGGEVVGELLYGRLVDPFWDALVGVRVDRNWGEGEDATRAHLALGMQGLAPGWFEVSPTVYVSQDGDVSAEFTASYDLLFTQRLILEPELTANLAIQEVPEFGVGSGLNDFELAARMRYEVRRKFGPYVGVSWNRLVAGTADLAREHEKPVSSFTIVLGVRAWR